MLGYRNFVASFYSIIAARMATTEPRSAVERDSWTLLRAPDEPPSSPALAAPTGVATPSAPVVADGTSETTRLKIHNNKLVLNVDNSVAVKIARCSSRGVGGA